jgi:transcriptional regulator with GAF, ATPase, and Fis domain
MAMLRYFPADGSPRLFAITKPVFTMGRGEANDVVLRESGVLSHHAQIVYTGRDFQIEELDRGAEILINGKRKRRARLVDGDRLTFGHAHIGFSMFSEAARSPESSNGQTSGVDSNRVNPPESSEISGLRKLYEFSERLMNQGTVDELLEALLDGVIQVTGAARGAVLLVEPDDPAREPRVRASRNVQRDAIEGPAGGVSDSIVRHVVSTRRPLLVSDALSDTTFGKSDSVLALQLSSVMCAPLVHQGEVIGVLYVGNDQIKSLFERAQLDLLVIFASQASLILQNAMLLAALREDKLKLSKELSDKRFGEIIGACPSMLEVFRKIKKVATTDISVLVTGETGTGKELIAHELHVRSNRSDGPFVTVNCGAIPENLIESELFGHVKGAFTGAVASRTGKFQQANAGTLFLDEIGELAPPLQVKLLRALQERVVYRVGDSKPEKCDIRVIAATNRNLEEMIVTGEFREDLYYRLNVVNLWLPPLRERGEDTFIIAKALLSKYADELQSPVKGFSPGALTAIRRYAWPGNIRQLENRIKKALVLCDRSLLSAEDLDLGGDAQAPIVPLEKAKEDFQRQYVMEVLERNNGNRTQTARDLGVDPRTIFRYLERESNPIPSGGSK